MAESFAAPESAKCRVNVLGRMTRTFDAFPARFFTADYRDVQICSSRHDVRRPSSHEILGVFQRVVCASSPFQRSIAAAIWLYGLRQPQIYPQVIQK
jgi:hypothetical protein